MCAEGYSGSSFSLFCAIFMLWPAEGATTLQGIANASGSPEPSQHCLNSLEAVTEKDDDSSFGEHSEQFCPSPPQCDIQEHL